MSETPVTATPAVPAAPGQGAPQRGTPWRLAASCAALARDRADHPAVRCEDRCLSYAELHRYSNRLAHALRSAGVRRGDRVAFYGRESEHYYALVLACAKLGCVIVPVNWRLTAHETGHILSDSGAGLLFVADEFATTAERARAAAPGRTVRLGDHGAGLRDWCADEPEDDVEAEGPGPDDAVAQIYTSGTTGLPKGVMLAQRSFFSLPAALGDSGGEWIDWLPDDVSLVSLPGFGIGGLAWFLHGFNAGATNVVMPAFHPQEALRLVREHRVTTTFAAPAMLEMLLDERGAGPEAFASLRKVAYGAAPVTEKLLLRFMDELGCALAQIYASTETGSVAVCLPPAAHRPGSPLLASVGRACPGNEIRITDDEGRTLPPGRTGQIRIRTHARMLGYWNNPGETARAVAGEWVRMGDVGRLDPDGYLYLTGRQHDTIICAGQNIYPAEIERELVAHPEVADAAVVGLPHPRWGESVGACVVPRPGSGVSAGELVARLRGRLANYKLPTSLHMADALPRNPSGKVLRRDVREWLLAADGDR
ncbi:long-chain-fatty-acid--CoA ligase [Streptomyces iconiensis]|uniref:Long-chain-fatty-acid--CoA ligase n=1 Tax=Streptomyces iconiensis TaxID=1384038 RepID=A0ABT7A420_9ACTN|nr:long-chain-fatty-acid--CoA ligase [Streptomyces iconiensis]MDJ1135792.1 long-chain-fatty-acid--CoA ligase [Streptomyces iconiensis]